MLDSSFSDKEGVFFVLVKKSWSFLLKGEKEKRKMVGRKRQV